MDNQIDFNILDHDINLGDEKRSFIDDMDDDEEHDDGDHYLWAWLSF